MNIEEVDDNVFWLNTTIDGVKNTFAIYLIREGNGVLIEPGPAITLPLIQDALKKLGMKRLSYIIPTHVHVDHAGGTGSLASVFPEAAVILHPRGKKHLIDPDRLVESTKTVWGAEFEKMFGPVLSVPESQIKVPLDGEIFLVGHRELEILYAPGHAPHQVVVFDRKSRSLFCGEALGLVGRSEDPFPLPAVAPPSFEQEQYLKTMEQLRKLKPRRLLFSHGGPIQEADKIFSIALENTRAFGNIVLQALRDGEALEEIGHRVVDYVRVRFGRELDETDLIMTVGGYVVYFKSKGLLKKKG